MGRDHVAGIEYVYDQHFNPRAPCGARRRVAVQPLQNVYFNPRAPCGARRPEDRTHKVNHDISIHAPRVGRDEYGAAHKRFVVISIHAPRVGRDVLLRLLLRRRSVFQSTRPVWGATWSGSGRRSRHTNFNPRAPCGARQILAAARPGAAHFQSTRPVWGATDIVRDALRVVDISIHAPRVGRDHAHDLRSAALVEFQSTRPVWGATPSALFRSLHL